MKQPEKIIRPVLFRMEPQENDRPDHTGNDHHQRQNRRRREINLYDVTDGGNKQDIRRRQRRRAVTQQDTVCEAQSKPDGGNKRKEKAALAEDQRQRERKEDNQRIIEKLPRTICQVGNAGSKGTPGQHFQSEIDQKSGCYVRKESDNILYTPLAPDCGKRES